MSLRKAVYWSIFWVALSLLFNGGVFYFLGKQKAIEFLTGYVIEKSLSVDNLFVFLIIFTLFDIQPHNQRRVLNYGIIGVLLLRGILILLGSALVQEFSWILYLFGAFLFYTGYKMVFGKEKKINYENNIVVRWLKKIFPFDSTYDGVHFFTKKEHVIHATPLFLTLVIIETTDVIFAVDSIPAIFAITTDPFIVLTSNIMAVLGLRSMYFVLVHIQKIFIYVRYGVGVVLGFVGAKMLAADVVHINTVFSLAIVMGVLTISVILSYFKQSRSIN